MISGRLFCCGVLGVWAVAFSQETWYVDANCGDDAWTGLSDVCVAPDGPKRTIQAAVALAHPGEEIVLAAGVYRGPGNVGIRWGGAAMRSAEGPLVTIIDGEGVSSGIKVYGGVTPTCRIEGVTFQNMSQAIEVTDACVDVVGCRFIDNGVGFRSFAGALFSDHGRASAFNCEFIGNNGFYGGAIFAWVPDSCLGPIVNCTFVDNTTHWSEGVGAIWVLGDPGGLRNCVVRGEGPQVHFGGPVEYCNIEGGFPGEGNIDADPMFVDAGAGDYRLRAGSPCVDAADNFAVPAGIMSDMGGLPRFVDDPRVIDTGRGTRPIVDMGAHEYQPPCYADCDGSGDLTIFDFLCYQNVFVSGDPSADLDGDGLLTLFDFLAFQNAYAAGCG